MTLRLVLVIAGLTLREFVRRRVVWVLLVLVIASVALVGWGTERLVTLARENDVAELEIRIGVSQVLILIAFMFSFVLAMSAAFLAAPAIASDVETGTVLAMLARPLRRSDLLLGRWLGLSIVVGGYAALSGLLAIAVVDLVSGHVPPSPLVAVGLPRVPGDHRPHARAVARHAAAGHRRGRDHRRPVRRRLVRRACWAASRSCSRRRRSPRRRT